jgi:hypothetical protein
VQQENAVKDAFRATLSIGVVPKNNKADMHQPCYLILKSRAYLRMTFSDGVSASM